MHNKCNIVTKYEKIFFMIYQISEIIPYLLRLILIFSFRDANVCDSDRRNQFCLLQLKRHYCCL